MSDLTYDEWLEHGIAKGFCSTVACSMHAGLPTTEAEDWIMAEENPDRLDDPCLFGVRVFPA